MTDEQIGNMIQQNQELLLLVGYAAGIIKRHEHYIEKEHYDWFMKSIDNVIYLKKQLPKMGD